MNARDLEPSLHDATRAPRRGRARRVLGVLGSVVGVTVTFVTGVAAALVLHLDTGAVRRLVATQGTGFLRQTLAGDVTIERVGHLGLDGVSGLRVRVADPDGIQVIHVDGVGARVDAVAIARSALFGKGPIAIDVTSVEVGHADVNLDGDGRGSLRIANTFVLRHPSPDDPNTKPSRGVRLEAPAVTLGHGWAHGTPPDALFVDAELSGLVGRARVDPAVITAEVLKVALVARALPRRVDPNGALSGSFAMPSDTGQGFDVTAAFDGVLGGIPSRVNAHLRDTNVDAWISARDPDGARVNLLAPEVSVHGPVALRAEVHGNLPSLAGTANVEVGPATVSADARVVLGDTIRVEGALRARDVDLAAVRAGAPASSIGLDGAATVSIHGSDVNGRASVTTQPSVVAGQALPVITADATFAGQTAEARATIIDRRMPTTVTVSVAPRTDGRTGQAIAARLSAKVPDLHALPEVALSVGGSAEVEASARLALPEQTLEATADVKASKVSLSSFGIGVAEAHARATGTVDRPIVDVDLRARELLTGTLPLAWLEGSARIERVGDMVTVRGPRVETKRLVDGTVKASARLVRIGPGHLVVEGAEVLGVGDPIHADIERTGGATRATIDAPRIDVPLAARLAGQEERLAVKSGTVALKGSGTLSASGEAEGEVHVEARDVVVRELRTGNARLDATVHGRDVALALGANMGKTGRVAITGDAITLAGPPIDPRSWTRASGKVAVVGEIDLARVTSMLPQGTLPFADLRGILGVQGSVGRDRPNAGPEIQLHAHTLGLLMAGRGGKAVPASVHPDTVPLRVEEAPTWRSVGVDVGLDVRNDASSGLTGVAVRWTDVHGMVAAFDAKAILPYEEILQAPATAQDRLMSAPMSARLVVPPRRLDQFPAILGLRDVEGAVEADVAVGGTVLDPRAHVAARGRGVRMPAMPIDARSDADLALDYDGATVWTAIRVRANDRDLLSLTSQVQAKARDFLAAQPTHPPDWTASATLKMAGFPLQSIPQLADKRVRGKVSGELALEGLHRDAKVHGRLSLERLAVGKARYDKGEVTVDTRSGALTARVRLDQSDGFVDASASSGLAWGTALVPSLDEHQPLEARLQAKNFRAAALQPFVDGPVGALDGRLDADASAKLVPGRPGAELRGDIAFRDGIVEVAALGDELRDVRAKVTLAPDGTIQVTDVFARGAQGEVTASASAKIDGMRLESATARFQIPDRKPFAVSASGTPIGQVAGTIVVKASQSADAKTTTIGVDVPKLNVELPQVTKTGVQPLAPQEDVRVGVYRGRKNFVKVPLDYEDTLPPKTNGDADPSLLDVAVHLGRVEVVRGNSAKVGLTGDLGIHVAKAETRITGQISALEGWADVQGKKFTVEKASVIFQGEQPPNPVVNATAGWIAQDGTHVYADFIGPVKSGKVTLRSEPGRTQGEILGLVLFGTTDGANPTASSQKNANGSAANTAVGLGGGFAAQGLTEALDDLSGIQATARIDTTNSNNPKPEVEFQVSPKVSIGFAHVLGTPPITEPDRNMATIDYRFRRNWSFETTVGDRGRALFDAVWQRRY